MLTKAELIREIEGVHDAPEFSLGTGLEDLDDIGGSLGPGSLTLIGGAPSMGKTTLALQVAGHVAMDLGESVLYVTTHGNEKGLLLRLTGLRASASPRRFRRDECSPEELDRLHTALGKVKSSPFQVNDAFGLTFPEMLEVVEDHHDPDTTHPLRLVIFDRLRDMTFGARRPDRGREVAYITATLRELARRMHLAVILTVETDEYYQDWDQRLPRAEDIRHFYAIGRHADTIMLLHRPQYYDPHADQSLAQVVCPRSSNGCTGLVNLKYDADSGFSDRR